MASEAGGGKEVVLQENDTGSGGVDCSKRYSTFEIHSLLFFSSLGAHPFPSRTTEALVDGSTERLRRLYSVCRPKSLYFRIEWE